MLLEWRRRAEENHFFKTIVIHGFFFFRKIRLSIYNILRARAILK